MVYLPADCLQPRVYSARNNSSRNGFTLLEILLTLLIVSLGMLGFAALQIKGLQSNHGAMLNSQAGFLAYDMAERIRANASVQNKYTITANAVPNAKDCSSSPCNPNAMAEADIYEWRQMCKALLPDGKGAISWVGQTGTIVITWSEQDNARSFSLGVNL